MNVTTVGKLFSSDHSLCICIFILEARNLINTVIVQKVSNRDLIMHQRTHWHETL